MELIFPFLTIFICLILGEIIKDFIKIHIYPPCHFFYSLFIGTLAFSILSLYLGLTVGYFDGFFLSQLIIGFLEVVYILFHKDLPQRMLQDFLLIFKDKYLVALFLILSIPLIMLFNTHILYSKNGDLYTGESTYGDLPFHLSSISSFVYQQKLPPDNPFYNQKTLAYPFLINFFSSTLVTEGWNLRWSIIIPGILLSLSLAFIIFDFALQITRNRLASFLAVLFYFFNGGLGFYFFLKDNSYNIFSMINTFSKPDQMTEYSHLFSENIQWGNFLTRMIVPERSLLFGIAAGILLLRLLFFRGNHTRTSIQEVIIAACLIGTMPIIHTHTVLSLMVAIPVLYILQFQRIHFLSDLKKYLLLIILSVLIALPILSIFLGHVGGSENFFKFHLGWMAKEDESLIWFWFKNTYLNIPISLIILFFLRVTTKETRHLQIVALILFVLLNIMLFSPYNWDNVKFLFWAGLFWAIAAGALFSYLLSKKILLLSLLSAILIFTMFSSAYLSLIREVSLRYVLFSKEMVDVGNFVKTSTPRNSIFLTYRVHNSPVNNLAGRQILMGYPGMLWVHGIDYSERENDIFKMYQGSPDADSLFNKYNLDYIVVEKNSDDTMLINRSLFENYPKVYESDNYLIYKLPKN